MRVFDNVYKNKKVFVTGHTGFKGSWLIAWLDMLEAEVMGYSLEPVTHPNHFELLDLKIKSVFDNVCNSEKLEKELINFEPDIIFHLAAQPLVRYSYKNPKETYLTNVIGTLNILEASRKLENLKAIVFVTTDKVYNNNENKIGYIETDKLGGIDPYSSSKACSELLIQSYNYSFFLNSKLNEKRILTVTARGGNVIGGGDWSEDRIIPDIVRSIINNQILEIRNPESVRPWQHVLDCLSGYLLLGKNLLLKNENIVGPWNFGPLDKKHTTVNQIIELASSTWRPIRFLHKPSPYIETDILVLDCTKANSLLRWTPLLDNRDMFIWTFKWYKDFYSGKLITKNQILDYIKLGYNKNVDWLS